MAQDEAGGVQTLDMWLDVNGARMQNGNVRTMIFDGATLVSYVSEFRANMYKFLLTMASKNRSPAAADHKPYHAPPQALKMGWRP